MGMLNYVTVTVCFEAANRNARWKEQHIKNVTFI